MRGFRLTSGCAIAFAASAFLTAAPAAARGHTVPLRCGDRITTDTRLTVDLANCSGNGLVIAKDGVTLDLAGHRILGTGTTDSAGIDVEGRRDVTIENGTVHGFAEDVLVLGSRQVALRRLTVTGAGHGGVLVDRSSRVTVRATVARACGSGIVLTRSSRVRVVENRVADSSFGGIPVFSSRRVVIARNDVTRSRTDMAIGLVNGTSQSVVRRNHVSRSAAGIAVADGSSHNVIVDNVVRRNDSGVILDAGTHDNVVAGNMIDTSAFEGIAVVGSDHDVITANRVARGGWAEPAGGIVVIPLPDDPGQTSDGNLVSGNVARHNGGAGITIGGGQAGNIVRSNGAYGNTALGIDAGDGAIDGGGNRAAHNGDPRQCVGVTC